MWPPCLTLPDRMGPPGPMDAAAGGPQSTFRVRRVAEAIAESTWLRDSLIPMSRPPIRLLDVGTWWLPGRGTTLLPKLASPGLARRTQAQGDQLASRST